LNVVSSSDGSSIVVLRRIALEKMNLFAPTAFTKYYVADSSEKDLLKENARY
jgi:hypothetical protein